MQEGVVFTRTHSASVHAVAGKVNMSLAQIIEAHPQSAHSRLPLLSVLSQDVRALS